ncbi:unnamed protein product [Bemisia tabaci]|uniref:MICOS complex subunit MIC19 n=1 Tax=Bemisia tabaci TaxID=7038 RepID=A0A9P0A065_BEMTA|nr:PREDICTED: MICOS complex subunit MIC19 [Bemisia tabaci]CAH0381239.1 unnamed protein product [Bemisia tabaci]
MGSGSSSTRKVEVENDGTVIRVSDAVVDRLKGIKPESKPESERAVYPNQHHVSPNSLTSLDVKRLVEKELAANDQYWNDRLLKLQASSRSIEDVMKLEYYQAIKEIESMYPERSFGKKVPCEDVKKNILKCYEENRHQALKCSQEVLKFQNCLVNKAY